MSHSDPTPTRALIKNDQDSNVCRYIEGRNNRGLLDKISVKGATIADDSVPIPDELSDEEILFKAKIDINSDGKVDYVYVVRSHLFRDVVLGDTVDQSESESAIDHETAHFAIYDQNMVRVQVADAEDLSRLPAPGWPHTIRVVRYSGTYYLVGMREAAGMYVAYVDPQNRLHHVCAFDYSPESTTSRNRMLTRYEWLVQSLRRQGIPIWEYAFSQDDLSVANFLLRNGHILNDGTENASLVAWAIAEHRTAVFDWLLRNGAEIHRNDLAVALDARDAHAALKLIPYGVHPSLDPHLVADLIRPQDSKARSVVIAYLSKLEFIPEEILITAAIKDAELLLPLADMGLPVRPLGLSWHAGVRTPITFSMRQARNDISNQRIKDAIDKLFRRPTKTPLEKFAVASYGTFADGVQFIRYNSSNLSDDQFLNLTTAFCLAMLPYDCGPEPLIRTAHEWAGGLTTKCSESMAEKIDAASCHIVGYYGDLRGVTGFSIIPSRPNENNRALDGKRLVELYSQKVKGTTD